MNAASNHLDSNASKCSRPLPCEVRGSSRPQAKGSFKVMTDKVAERLDADIILPASSGMPEHTGRPTRLNGLTGRGRW